VSLRYRVKHIPMYSVQFIVMNILQCRVKCVVHWRGGKEGSCPERKGQPLLPPFKACTVCSTVYFTLHSMQYSLLYIVHCANNELYNIQNSLWFIVHKCVH
jgi:hypothetical protein